MLDRFDNPSGVARRFIAAGLAKANAPGTKEIEKLTEIREELRRIGVNLNQAVKALNADPKNAKRVKELMSLIKELSEVKEKALEAMRGLNEKTPL